jgi:MATE family multidrug resistance protein
LFVFLPRQIARTYTHDQQVISLSLKLLRVAAVFQLFDGLQVVATGALRGAGDTRTAMVWNLAGYWVVGLPLGCWLCFVIGWGVTGLWWGLCLALVVIGAALVKVWHNEANRICAKVT